MIGKLTGKIDAVGEAHLILDVNGVGYEVQASSRTLRNLKSGDAVSLTIDTHVREDAIRLYGFASEVERSWFRTLQNVQGVGAKVALAVLGVLSTNDLASAIALGNAAAVEQAPGVGKKLAQRIVIELKEKAPSLSLAAINSKAGAAGPAGALAGAAASAGGDGLAVAEAISALTNLGYNPAQASQAVSVAIQELGSGAETAQLIRRGLKELAR
ncbi:MAG: Holliday junction branch migration protein RuvA [Hyphomicrobiaceae bacterium]